MKIKYSITAAFASMLLLTACNDNSWNNLYIDDFDGNSATSNPVTVTYTLTDADYQAIGKALYKSDGTPEEQAAANSIRDNHFFDQTSPFPIEVAVPVFLDQANTDFQVYDVGSKVQVGLAVAQGVPEELKAISAAPRLKLYGTPSSSEIASQLSSAYPGASAGQSVVVSYENGTSTSTRSAKTRSTSNLSNNSVGRFIYTPKSLQKQGTRAATSVWTVDYALTQMNGGYTGEAIVSGVISSITEISTSFGNATYYIKDALADEQELLVYRGYGYGNEKFTSEDDLKVGQQVYVSGKLVDYNGTFEFTTGSQLLTESELPSGGGSGSGGDSGSGDTGSGSGSGSGDTGTGGGSGSGSGGTLTPGEGMEYLTSKIKDLTSGQTLTATAMVTAQSSNGVVLTDMGGSIFYFNPSINLKDYAIGTVVYFSGNVAAFNNGFQIDNTALIIPVGDGAYVYPTPAAYTGAQIDAACKTTTPFQPVYVSVEGVLTISGNYYNLAVDGASSTVSIYNPSAEIKALLQNGQKYTINGYFTSVTASGPFFNIIATEVEAYLTNELDLTNVIYTYTGSAWSPATNATVLAPSAYSHMGFSINALSNPELYLPNYMKTAFPYALPDTEMFVAYNLKDTSCGCSLLIFDGTNWSVNNNYLENRLAEFSKSADGYLFRKYLGEETYYPFTANEIQLNAGYLFVANGYDVCAGPVEPTSGYYAYMYPQPIEFNEEDGSVTIPTSENTYTFLSEVEYNGNIIQAPEGKFVIQQADGKFIYCGTPSYYNFGVRADNPWINSDGTIQNAYLWSATKQSDGTWEIACDYQYQDTGDWNHKIIWYSDSYSNFANYTPAQFATHSDAVLIKLYISEDFASSSDNDNNTEE